MLEPMTITPEVALPSWTARLSSATSMALCIVLPVAMVIANKSAPLVLIVGAVLANASAIAGFGLRPVLKRYVAAAGSGTGRCLSILTLGAILSLAWSISGPMTQRGLVEALPELGAGWALAAAWPLVVRPTDFRMFRVGLIAAAAFIAFEAMLALPLHRVVGARSAWFDLKRSAVPVVLLLWPALAVFVPRKEWRWVAALIVAALAASAFAHAAAAVVSVLTGCAIYGVARVIPRVALYGFAAASLTLLVLTPWTGTIAGHMLDHGTREALSEQHATHRVEIWSAFERHIRSKHLIGHGFNTSFRMASIVEDKVGADSQADRVIVNIHPHNVLLQVWIEFGTLGAVAVGVAVVFMFFRLRRLRTDERAIRLAFLGACATLALVGLNAWSPWWLATVALGLVVFSIQNQKAGRPSTSTQTSVPTPCRSAR